MGQILHGSAKTTHAVRALIQRSKASNVAFSRELGIKVKKVVKWRTFGYLEAHRFLRFALQYRRTLFDLTRCYDVDNLHLHQVIATKSAVDGHVEQREVAVVLCQLKPYSNCPDMLGFEWAFLTDDPSLVPGWAKYTNCGQFWGLCHN